MALKRERWQSSTIGRGIFRRWTLALKTSSLISLNQFNHFNGTIIQTQPSQTLSKVGVLRPPRTDHGSGKGLRSSQYSSSVIIMSKMQICFINVDISWMYSEHFHFVVAWFSLKQTLRFGAAVASLGDINRLVLFYHLWFCGHYIFLVFFL